MSATTTATTLVTAVAADTSKPSFPAKPPGYDSDDPTTNLNVLPTFPDKYAERKWAKEQMVAIFRVFSRHGFADGFNGHISLRGT
jgi:hypothetical protein